MHAAWVAGQRHRLEILCPPRRESGREKRSPFRSLRLPSQRCCPDPGSRRPIPVSTPCVLNGPPVPCVTAARGRSKTRARESFRRTCDRLAGYPAEISWSGRHPPPSTVACTSAPPLRGEDPCWSSTPTCRRSALLPRSCPRQRRTAFLLRAGICDTPCCPPATCPPCSTRRAAKPPPLRGRGGPWSLDPRSGTPHTGAHPRPRLLSPSAVTDRPACRSLAVLPRSGLRAPPPPWLP